MHPVPVFLLAFGGRGNLAFQAGVVEGGIQPAECFHGRGDGRIHLFAFRHITVNIFGPAAGLPNFLRQFFAFRILDVGQRQGCALPGHHPGGGHPDPGCRAGHEDRFRFQRSHTASLRRRSHFSSRPKKSVLENRIRKGTPCRKNRKKKRRPWSGLPGFLRFHPAGHPSFCRPAV
jgi:hypothetical protein